MRNKPPGPRAGPGTASGEIFPGAGLTPEEVEFGRAMHAWQLRWRRRPTCADVLAVARALGYRKAAPGA